MEMRASQVIKGALGGGAKKNRKKEKNERRNRERREEEGWGGTFKSVKEVKCHSYLAPAEKHVSNVADLTSLSTKVIITFDTFCNTTGFYPKTTTTHLR